jgi:SAM-dependent methyltransferase
MDVNDGPASQTGFAQAYGDTFARVYNERWTFFATRIAPQLLSLFDSLDALSDAPRSILDLCCGTGQLAGSFLEAGYDVTGIDLSPAMLRHARENNEAAIADDRARFSLGDAASFSVQTPVTFAVSVFDSLNHLPDANALSGCFESVYRALRSPGVFVFDLNTPTGLRRWNGITFNDTEDLAIINRGIYPAGAGRAYTYITGFLRQADGLYERFDEAAYNTVFASAEVLNRLSDAGFGPCYVAANGALSDPVDSPDQLDRVFYVCSKE